MKFDKILKIITIIFGLSVGTVLIFGSINPTGFTVLGENNNINENFLFGVILLAFTFIMLLLEMNIKTKKKIKKRGKK